VTGIVLGYYLYLAFGVPSRIYASAAAWPGCQNSGSAPL
jgi:hypothetical protein